MDFKRLTQKELAEVLELSDRRIRQWHEESKDTQFPLPVDKSGSVPRYRLKDVIEWREEEAIRKYQSKSIANPENKAEADLEKIIVETKLKKLELARKENELLDASDVERVWSQSLNRFRDVLLRSSQSLASDIVSLENKSFNNIRDCYDKITIRALEELSTKDRIEETEEEITDIEFNKE